MNGSTTLDDSLCHEVSPAVLAEHKLEEEIRFFFKGKHSEGVKLVESSVGTRAKASPAYH